MTEKEQLSERYKELHPEHKRPYGGWTEDEIKQRITEMENGGKPSEEPTENKPKTITMTEDQLNSIIQKAQSAGKENAEIEAVKSGGWQTYTPEKDENKKAKMKVYRNNEEEPFKLVVDWKRIRLERDEVTREMTVQIYKLTLLDDDGKTSEKEMRWEEFMKIDTYETVEIISTRETPLRKSHGMVRRAPKVKGYTYSRGVDLDVDSVGKSGGMVEAWEIAIDHTHKVKRPNGQIITINNSRLNP